jgi:hypothetical protein
MNMQAGDVFDHIWEMYTNPIRDRIRARATEIAKTDGDCQEMTAADAFDALREFIPGRPVAPSLPERPQGWFNKNVSGFIGITAVLALCFGALGLVPFFSSVAAQSTTYAPVAQGFLEVAKIFAGALVGGAAGAAATAKR